MRMEWELPKEQLFRDTGQDWVLLLLNQCSEEVRSKLLFMWWRSWLGDGKCSVKQSAQFIHSYLTSFMQAKYSNSESDIKGKNLAIEPCIRKANEIKKEPEVWCKPEEG
jgi:hypothetical protein